MPKVPRFALAFALVAAALAPLSLAGPGSRAYTVETVEVSEGGFNPGICRMNREYVRFQNVGNGPIRVVRHGVIPGDPPLIDTGVLEPGEYSNEILIPHGGSTVFYDFDRPDHSMTVITPVFVTSWQVICTPDPDFRPPVPPCRSNPYCLRVASVSRD